MSIVVQAWVYANSEARLAERLVLLAIADEADDDGMNAFPSQRRIAAKARLAVNTARAAIDRLEASGEILVHRPERQGRGHHSEYVVLMGRNPIEIGIQVGWRKSGAEDAVTGLVKESVNPEHLSDGEKRAGTRGNARPKADTDPLTPRPSEDPSAKVSVPRPRFEEFDALVDAFGEPGTREEAAFYARTARSLKAQLKTPDEIRDRGKRARERHPTCTPNVLLTRWSNFARPDRQSGKWDQIADADRRAAEG